MQDPIMMTAEQGRIVSLESLAPGESGVVEIIDAGGHENGLAVRLRAMGRALCPPRTSASRAC